MVVDLQNAFEPTDSARPSHESVGFDWQKSAASHTLSHDRKSLNETFQRIKIAGDFHDLSHIEDLEESIGPLLRALVIREKYRMKNKFDANVCSFV